MDISQFIKQFESIPVNLARNDLIKNIKDIEIKVYDYLKKINISPWIPGKGLSISTNLCLIKDNIIKKVIEAAGIVQKGIAVVAVGGYGRGELSPYSDIDLLIIHTDRAPIENFAKDFLYILWDLNYHLGSSTRTISNIIEQAYQDEHFLTSVFEARFIAGDEELYSKLNPALKKVISRKRIDYLKLKIIEIYSIFQNGDSKTSGEVLLREPNLKTNAGGLRSVHLMEWLNFIFYFRPGFEGLKESLPYIYFKKLNIAYDFILYIRNMLHFMNGRKEDNLYMNSHLTVAKYLNLTGDDGQKMKRLMKHYYEKAMDILIILLYFLEELNIKYLRGAKDKSIFNKRNSKNNFFLLNNQFFVKEGVKPSVDEAFDLLFQFTQIQFVQKKCFYTFSLINYLKKTSFLISDNDRISRVTFKKFRKILELNNSYEALTVMKLSGFIYRYIPLFGKIKHLILYNPFHKYTVDQHSIESVRAMETLFSIETDSFNIVKFMTLQELAEKYKNSLWVIKLCLLLHDVGKNYEGDHSKNGVEIAQIYLKKIPIYSSYKHAILFLIKNHLLLSNIVRRRDISSIQILIDLSYDLSLTPFPEEYLDFLYLITYADTYATNQGNFTGYFSGLLTQVYKNTTGLLQRKINRDYHKDIIKQAQSRLETIAEGEDVAGFIESMGDKYVLTHSEEDIIQDYKIFKEVKQSNYKIEIKAYNDYFKVKFFMKDRIGLFSLLTGILFINGADIIRADIHTYQGIALDEFYINRIFGLDFSMLSMNEQLSIWKEDLEKYYINYEKDFNSLKLKINSFKEKIKNINSFFHRQSEVYIREKDSDYYNVEISCTDRPALLYDVASFFSENKIDIFNAIIDTTGWYVHDEFDVKASHKLITNEKRAIQEELIKITNNKPFI